MWAKGSGFFHRLIRIQRKAPAVNDKTRVNKLPVAPMFISNEIHAPYPLSLCYISVIGVMQFALLPAICERVRQPVLTDVHYAHTDANNDSQVHSSCSLGLCWSADCAGKYL